MKDIGQRRKYILERLKKDDYVKVHELSNILGVSEVTIRKDLKYLEEKKMLLRNHGSASNILSILPERHINEKEKIQVEEKYRIAEFAKGLIEQNDRIIIASGTTTLAFANAISNSVFPFTVITPSIKATLALCRNSQIDIVQLGGSLRKNAASTIGPEAEEPLLNLSFNKLFCGVDGFDLEYGLTTSSIGEAHLHKQMIESSNEIIVLMDSTKFEKRGFCKICNINKIHHVITDKNAPTKIVEQLQENGVKVTLV